MKTFQLCKIYIGAVRSSGVYFYSTNPDLVLWFLNEIKATFPKAYIDVLSKDLDLNERIVGCFFKGLKGHDHQVHFWLQQKLLELGWEPFSTQGDYMWFRMESSQQA